MDSQTHVEYAKRILGEETEIFAMASLFPQIDRTPATLHRNYAHHLVKAKPLVDLGLQVMRGLITEENADNYPKKRFVAEKHRIQNYFPEYDFRTLPVPENSDSAVLAFISHIHLDTFNQPVQAFTPDRSVCSGQWDLWDKIGDFRYRLYVEHIVDGLREEWLQSKLWNDHFEARDLASAMVYRLASLSSAQLSDDFVFSTLKKLGLSTLDKKHPAIEWLKDFENELSSLHIKYLK